jgi:cytochrome c oxidase subunit 1
MFIANVVRSLRSPEQAPDDPWDARTLEWATTSPPPHYNFAQIPIVHALDDFWHRKYTVDDQGRRVRVPSGAANGDHEEHGHDIHMPSPSYYPAVAALALPVIAYGAIYGWWFGALGALVAMSGIFGWAREPLAEPAAH